MSALETQVGGDHYKKVRIQPVEYISANGLNFLEGCIVKRITRWRDKDGFKDLEKIKHEVDLLIEMEKRYGADTVAKPGGDMGIGRSGVHSGPYAANHPGTAVPQAVLDPGQPGVDPLVHAAQRDPRVRD